MDGVLLASGLLALAAVMVLLVLRPGRQQRSEVIDLVERADAREPGQDHDDRFAAQVRAISPLPRHCVFISYRRADSGELVGRLDDHLARTLDRGAVFKDVDSIQPGKDFREQIDQSLAACKVFLCVIGGRWEGPGEPGARTIDGRDDMVRLEVETALRRGIPIIPLLARGISMPMAERFPESIRQLAFLQGIPLRLDPDFHTDVARVLSSMLPYLAAR